MPDSTIAFLIDLPLYIIGIILIWRWGLSARGRAARGTARVSHWGVPWYIFAITGMFVIVSGLFFEGFFVQVCRWFFKEMPLETNFGYMLGSGAMHLGAIMGMLLGRRFLLAMQQLSNAIPPPAPTLRPAQPIGNGAAVLAGFGVFTIVTCVLTVLGLFWPWLLERFGIPAKPQNLVELFQGESSPVRLAILTFIAVILPPVSEEMLFRGGMFGYMRTRTPRWLALLIPSTIFALLHFNLTVFPLLLTLGIILSIAYERTGRIIVPMIAHGLLNLHTIVFLLLLPKS